jgi:hypothetical protein
LVVEDEGWGMRDEKWPCGAISFLMSHPSSPNIPVDPHPVDAEDLPDVVRAEAAFE